MSRYKAICKSYKNLEKTINEQMLSMEQADNSLKTQALMNIDVTLAHMLDLMERKYEDEKKAQCKQS